MLQEDVDFLKSALLKGHVQSPCLEMGVGLEGVNTKELLEENGIEYRGTDITNGDWIDYVIDFEEPIESIKSKIHDAREFKSIICFNVLEHVFDPIRILDNIMSLLAPGGTCLLVAPAVWPLHSFPIDCWRILPDFYVEYAKRNNHILLEECFEYVGKGNLNKHVDPEEGYQLPHPGKSKNHHLWSRIVHKLFNTAGRGMFFPSHVASASTGLIQAAARQPSCPALLQRTP